MRSLRRLALRASERDTSLLRRESALLLNVVSGALMLGVCLGFGGGAERMGVVLVAAAMALSQVLLLTMRVPADGDWVLLTLLQAMVPATATLSLTASQEALMPLLLLNVAWAAAILPGRVVLGAMVWNLVAAATPAAVQTMRDGADPDGPIGRTAVLMVVMVMTGLCVQLLAAGMRQSKARSDTESRTDALTGLFNRRHTSEALHDETRLAARSERPCAVLMVDVDHFKAVNDTYGHAAGDEVLVAVARRILARARSGDVATRWGGEEFLLLARDIPNHRALASLAEDVRASCAGTVRVSDGRIVPVTVSVGAGLSADYPTPNALVEAADRAMYEAKRAGRNRAELSGAPRTLGVPLEQ